MGQRAAKHAQADQHAANAAQDIPNDLAEQAATACRQAAVLKTIGLAYGGELILVNGDKFDEAMAKLKGASIPEDLTHFVDDVTNDIDVSIAGIKATKERIKSSNPELWESTYQSAMAEMAYLKD